MNDSGSSPPLGSKQWNDIAGSFGNTSILQSREWAETKEITGWTPDYYLHQNEVGKINAASLVLTREEKLSGFGPVFRIIYLPHGPLLDWSDEELVISVLQELKDYSKSRKASFIKIDPQAIPADKRKDHISPECIIKPSTIQWMVDQGWLSSTQQIQFKNTFWVDLSFSEDELLANMKQKTRYNLRLSGRKGIEVRQGTIEDLNMLYEMYLETSTRDGFIIRPKDYYLHVWTRFMRAGMAVPLIAAYQGEPAAALILFYFAGKSYYLYGMSTEKHREKMPNYLLQWEAIKLSKKLNCKIYDLWGAPDVFDDSDRMWGVYRFKEGLGAEVIETLGAYDFPTSRFTYTIIQRILPSFQKLTRRMRRKQMLEELEQT
jgi:peptidoglycan pentaglycine glycine transferase (the first glycine)